VLAEIKCEFAHSTTRPTERCFAVKSCGPGGATWSCWAWRPAAAHSEAHGLCEAERREEGVVLVYHVMLMHPTTQPMLSCAPAIVQGGSGRHIQWLGSYQAICRGSAVSGQLAGITQGNQGRAG
jgi:hypothetical protein